MYKELLILTDNPHIGRFFFDLMERSDFKCQFSMAISPYSDMADFANITDNKIAIYDLKNTDHVEKILQTHDLVFSIHSKQIFPPRLVNNVKCINVHPGYNPINRGWYPQVFAIIDNLPVGATIHEIDNDLDHGPIIAQEFVDIESFDTSGSLYDKIVAKEKELLTAHIESILQNSYTTFAPEGEGNLYLKKDFNNLLELDLNEEMTIGDCINRLRALTHGDFKNAFFIDPKTNKKVFLSIKLESES